jgi:hypothetical protein
VSVELRMLTFSVVLGIVQIIAASHAASLQRGYRWTASPRDEKVELLHGVAGRLERALRNFLETFPLFAAVVLIAHLTDTHNALTEWGARRAPGSTFGLASPTYRSTRPGSRWSVRWYGTLPRSASCWSSLPYSLGKRARYTGLGEVRSYASELPRTPLWRSSQNYSSTHLSE